MVQASMVQAKVQTGTISESEIVDVSAAAEARIRIAHRSDIGRARTLAISLLAELEAQTGGLTDFQSLGEMLRAPDDNNRDRLNDAYQAVIALPERTKTMKALAETLKVLVGLEREAYSIAPLAPDEPPPGKPPDISDPGAYYRWLSAQGAKA